jgi:nucleotide-binding universal stress UspA family protein
MPHPGEARNMVLLVPFDGSALAEAALARAEEFSLFTDDEIVTLSVFPDDKEFARTRGWVDEDEPYDPEAVAADLRAQSREVAPEARFRAEFLNEDEASMLATATIDITRRIREVAADERASIVFIGSENAGRVSRPVTSVGSPVSEDPRYDVHIVRHPRRED